MPDPQHPILALDPAADPDLYQHDAPTGSTARLLFEALQDTPIPAWAEATLPTWWPLGCPVADGSAFDWGVVPPAFVRPAPGPPDDVTRYAQTILRCKLEHDTLEHAIARLRLDPQPTPAAAFGSPLD